MTRKLTRRDFFGRARNVAMATPFLSLMGCSDDGDHELLSLGGETMGTTYSVKLVNVPPSIDTTALAREIEGLLETVNRQMSTYRPDSELARFNGAAAASWTPISSDTRVVIDEALRVSRLTGGAFDPTIGPIVDLWGFGPAPGLDQVPSSDAIAARRAAVGFAKVATRAEPAAVTKHAAGVHLDLSGVAKGFGVDKVAEHLDGRGLENYLVEVGGELRVSGTGPSGGAWRVGIEKPTPLPGDLQRVVELKRHALATSGDYRLFFERDGRRYSHIIDPGTGRPVDHNLASATVIAPTTMEADALSTSLLVLGPVVGMTLAVEHDIAAFFIAGAGETLTATASPAFERAVKA